MVLYIVLLPFLELCIINHNPLSLYGRHSFPITFSFSLKKDDATGLEKHDAESIHFWGILLLIEIHHSVVQTLWFSI